MSTHHTGGPEKKRMSTSMFILAACVLGVGIGLFGLNYWHATRCAGNRSPDEIENYIEALNKRLLQAESQVIRNGVMMDKLLTTLQSRLVKLEASEMETISKKSQDEAVKVALLLANQPAPPMPEFELDPKYQDAEELANVVDDILGKVGEKDDALGGGDYKTDDKAFGAVDTETVTDAEALEKCNEWKSQYSVVIGVSWGNLPYDLQQKWLKYSCDYHMTGHST